MASGARKICAVYGIQYRMIVCIASDVFLILVIVTSQRFRDDSYPTELFSCNSFIIIFSVTDTVVV